MKIKHRLEVPDLEEVKERIIESPVTPFVLAAMVALLASRMSSRQVRITVNVYGGVARLPSQDLQAV